MDNFEPLNAAGTIGTGRAYVFVSTNDPRTRPAPLIVKK